MIEQATVLVIGAGASCDFGYPTGEGLVHEICTTLAVGSPNYEPLRKTWGDEESLAAFRAALRDSAAMSVDAFLEHRRSFVEVGKMAIATCLIPHETSATLFETSKAGTPSWLRLLFERLKASRDDWPRNRLSIVTFNYDRVVEHFLMKALRNSFGLKFEEATAMLSAAIPIVHVHGSLGALPGFGDTYREYQPTVNTVTIREAAGGIHVVHEGDAATPAFQQARELLSKAEQIVFLGFGYHRTNMNRLGIRELPKGIALLGTSTGMKPTERIVARERSGDRITIDPEGANLVDYFRSTRILGF